uniref:B box-type domain-containing protein n=1 Tax=Steinernema glaseri TaxID=37863 RepID=A0A1I7Y093_9BILA
MMTQQLQMPLTTLLFGLIGEPRYHVVGYDVPFRLIPGVFDSSVSLHIVRQRKVRPLMKRARLASGTGRQLRSGVRVVKEFDSKSNGLCPRSFQFFLLCERKQLVLCEHCSWSHDDVFDSAQKMRESRCVVNAKYSYMVCSQC